MEHSVQHYLDKASLEAMNDIQARADAFLEGRRPALLELIALAADDVARTRVVLGHVDETVSHAVAPFRQRLACGRGCGHCCHQLVMLQYGEAQVMAEALRSLEPDERESVRRQSLEQMRVIQAASQSHLHEGVAQGTQRIAAAVHLSGLPCPMLDVDRQACRVYAARPSPCRATYSFDADRCSRHFGGAGHGPEEITEEMGIEMKSDPLIPSNRRIYPIGVIEKLVSAGRL